MEVFQKNPDLYQWRGFSPGEGKTSDKKRGERAKCVRQDAARECNLSAKADK